MHLCCHVAEIHKLLNALVLLILISCEDHIECCTAQFGASAGGLHNMMKIVHERGNALDG